MWHVDMFSSFNLRFAFLRQKKAVFFMSMKQLDYMSLFCINMNVWSAFKYSYNFTCLLLLIIVQNELVDNELYFC